MVPLFFISEKLVTGKDEITNETGKNFMEQYQYSDRCCNRNPCSGTGFMAVRTLNYRVYPMELMDNRSSSASLYAPGKMPAKTETTD